MLVLFFQAERWLIEAKALYIHLRNKNWKKFNFFSRQSIYTWEIGIKIKPWKIRCRQLIYYWLVFSLFYSSVLASVRRVRTVWTEVRSACRAIRPVNRVPTGIVQTVRRVRMRLVCWADGVWTFVLQVSLYFHFTFYFIRNACRGCTTSRFWNNVLLLGHVTLAYMLFSLRNTFWSTGLMFLMKSSIWAWYVS